MKTQNQKQSKRFGQAIAEYLVLTALIAIASIGIIQVISYNMRGRLNQVNSAINGEDRNFSGRAATEDQTRMVDMKDFNAPMIDVGGE